jgi:hypothetical protein
MRSEELWPLTAGGAASNPISGAKSISALNLLGCSARERALVDALIFTASNYRYECRAPEALKQGEKADLWRIMNAIKPAKSIERQASSLAKLATLSSPCISLISMTGNSKT